MSNLSEWIVLHENLSPIFASLIAVFLSVILYQIIRILRAVAIQKDLSEAVQLIHMGRKAKLSGQPVFQNAADYNEETTKKKKYRDGKGEMPDGEFLYSVSVIHKSLDKIDTLLDELSIESNLVIEENQNVFAVGNPAPVVSADKKKPAGTAKNKRDKTEKLKKQNKKKKDENSDYSAAADESNEKEEPKESNTAGKKDKSKRLNVKVPARKKKADKNKSKGDT